MPQTILEVCNLNKKYTNFALKDVSFSLKEGIIYGFIGRNGAGKTTTLKCIYNLVQSDSGEILYLDEDFQKNEIKAKKRNWFAFWWSRLLSKSKSKNHR